MKVIFKKDVGGVGQRGKIKEVSDGYALNFLIPNGMAEQATPDKVAAYQKAEEAVAKDQAIRDAEWEGYARKIDGGKFQILVKANEKGSLYKQLTAAEIVAEIKKVYSVDVPTDALVINAPIKQVGETDVTVKFGTHTAKVTLILKA